MKKQIKKLITVLLCVTTVFSVYASANALGNGYYSEGYYEGEYNGYREAHYKKTVYPFTFEVFESDAALVRIAKDVKGEITVPATIDGVPVTEIRMNDDGSEDKIKSNRNITKITLPGSIELISERAFYGFESLKEINIPDSVGYIADMTFKNCKSLKKISLPDGLMYIGYEAFANCTSFENFNIPSSVVSIDFSAFENTAFYNDASNWESGALYHEDVLISAIGISGKFSVKEGTRLITADAFIDCDIVQLSLPASLRYVSSDYVNAFATLLSLERFKVSKANPYYTADRQGVLYSKDKTVLVAYPRGSVMVSYSVPEGVRYIEDCIDSEHLVQVFLPKSIEDFLPMCESANIYYAGTRDEYSRISVVDSGEMDSWDEEDGKLLFGGDSVATRILIGGLLRAYDTFISNFVLFFSDLANLAV